jgi:hypothetical protein
LPRLALPLVAGPAGLFALLAVLALAPGNEARPTGTCPDTRPRDLPGEARELRAGANVWSAWITYPPVAGERITVLWRAVGEATPEFSLTGSDARGHRLAVTFGPSPVLPQLRGGGLQWPRQGREWGSRLLFSHTGCWRLRLDAGGNQGAVTLLVRRSA